MKNITITNTIFEILSPKEIIVIFDYANYYTPELSFIKIQPDKTIQTNTELKLEQFPLFSKEEIEKLPKNTLIETKGAITASFHHNNILKGLIYIIEPKIGLSTFTNDREKLLFTNNCIQFVSYICALAESERLQLIYDGLEDRYIKREKTAILGDLVPDFIHDINTPLGNANLSASEVLVYIKNIQQELASPKVSKSNLMAYLDGASELATIIQLNLKNALSLINDVRNIYKGKMLVETITFNLKQHLEDILLSLKPLLNGHKQKITIDCPDDIEITCKASVFFEIINNFLTNSIKYGFPDNEEGDIKIAVNQQSDNLITMIYQDSGKGIDEKIKDTAFERFVTSSEQKGSGLGMYIINQIVSKDLKGKISFESAPNNGVKFTITFPHPTV
jgi:signal transduction histidine kinase